MSKEKGRVNSRFDNSRFCTSANGMGICGSN